MKKLIFCLVFVLLISFLLNGQTAYHKFKPKFDQDKLVGPLKILADAYRVLQISRAEEKVLLAKKPSDRNLQQMIAGLKTAEERRAFVSVYKFTNDEKIKNSIFPPEVQKRWDSPFKDIATGVIEARIDPRQIKSPLLKVRRSFPSAEQPGVWMAFCEFAIKDAEAISSHPDIIRLYLNPAPQPDNNLGARDISADILRYKRGDRFDMGYTGEGVIVGIIDTGIDLTHGDFLDPVTGTSRILYLWDIAVTTAGRTPQDLYGLTGLNYGTVYTKAEIDAGTCPEIDIRAHGTHTSGTSAGNGNATGRYTGMAPRSDIVFVKELSPAGWEFIIEMARRENKPCVINCSWGLPFYAAPVYGLISIMPGDGTDAESQYLKDLLDHYGRAGNIVVKSAGNDGHNPTYANNGPYPYVNGAKHAQGTATYTTPVTHTLYKNSPSWPDSTWNYNDFAVRSKRPVRITITVPGVGDYVFDTGTSDWIDFSGQYNLTGIDANNNEYFGFIWMDEFFDWNPYPQGNWTVTVQALNPGDTAAYDIWVQAVTEGYLENYTTFTRNYSYREYILDSGASMDLLTVGAHTVRNSWTDILGMWHPHYLQPTIGDLADFSSVGPNRSAAGERITAAEISTAQIPGLKPEISAPGSYIFSAYSHDAFYAPGNMVDSAHQGMQGTSMAAPHVTGGIALILQKDRMKRRAFQSAGSVRHDLAQGLYRYRDSFVSNGAVGRFGWGYGKFNLWRLNDPPVCILSNVVKKSMGRLGLKKMDASVELNLDDYEFLELDASASYDFEDFSLTYHFAMDQSPVDIQGQTVNSTLESSGTLAKFTPNPDIEGTYRIRAWVNDGIVDSVYEYVTVNAKFYPVLAPMNGQIERKENRSGFYTEYVNILSWQNNPENRTTIQKTRIYRKAASAPDTSYQLIQELDPTINILTERGLKKEDLFTYKITSVNLRGKESIDALIISN